MAGYVGRCKEFSDFPKFRENYIKAFDRYISGKKKIGKWGSRYNTAEELFDLWMEDPKMQGQISLFEEE